MVGTLSLAVLFRHDVLSENGNHLEMQLLERSCAPKSYINTYEIREIGGRLVEDMHTPKIFAK